MNLEVLYLENMVDLLYLDKQNKRPAYVEDFWKIINWDFVSENLK